MSSRLSSLLVQDGLVSAKRVADAFQRQVIYGGTLDSNLLELKAVDEDDLINYLGRADGLPTQPTGIHAAGEPSTDVLQVFTREVAERFRAVPTALLPGGILRVLVADGVEITEMDALALEVQQRIEPWIVLEFRFVEAMERVYGVSVPSRYSRLLTRSNTAHQTKGWPAPRPIDPIPRFGSMSNLRLVPEPLPGQLSQAKFPIPAIPDAVEQTTQTTIPEQTTQMAAPEQTTQTSIPEQTTQMVAPEQTTQTTIPEQTPPATTPEPTIQLDTPDLSIQMAVPSADAQAATTDATVQMATPEPTLQQSIPESTIELSLPTSPTIELLVPETAQPQVAPPMLVPEAASLATASEPAPASPAPTEVAVAIAVAAAPAVAATTPTLAETSGVELRPTVMFDPNRLGGKRPGVEEISSPTASIRTVEPSSGIPDVPAIDELTVADWMSAADWLSVANKVDGEPGKASSLSPSRASRPPQQVPAVVAPSVEAVAVSKPAETSPAVVAPVPAVLTSEPKPAAQVPTTTEPSSVPATTTAKPAGAVTTAAPVVQRSAASPQDADGNRRGKRKKGREQAAQAAKPLAAPVVGATKQPAAPVTAPVAATPTATRPAAPTPVANIAAAAPTPKTVATPTSASPTAPTQPVSSKPTPQAAQPKPTAQNQNQQRPGKPGAPANVAQGKPAGTPQTKPAPIAVTPVAQVSPAEPAKAAPIPPSAAAAPVSAAQLAEPPLPTEPRQSEPRPVEPLRQHVPLAAAAPAATPAPAVTSDKTPVSAPPAFAEAAPATAAPEPIPEVINSGRLGERIVSAPAVAAAKAEPPASAQTPAGETAAPIRPAPRVAMALDVYGSSPLSPEAARELIESVTDRGVLFDLLCRGIRSRVAFAAVFTIHGDVAFGRTALGAEFFDRTQLGRISVQLDRTSPFRVAAKERTAYVGRVGEQAASAEPLRAMNRTAPVEGAILPIQLKGRAVALLYLDDDGYALASDLVDDLRALISDVGQALSRIQQQSKSGGLGVSGDGSVGEEVREGGTSAWRAPSSKSPALESQATPLPPAKPASDSPVPVLLADQATQPLHTTPAPKESAIPAAVAAQPTVPLGKPAAGNTSQKAKPTSPAAKAPQKADATATKASEAKAAAAPPSTASPGKSDLAALVERAGNKDEAAVALLIEGGLEAARAVVAALPGPLRSNDRQALGDPVGGPVWSRGPLLGLVLRIGHIAVEPILERLKDTSLPAETRYHLTLCLGEMPLPSTVVPLGQLLFDGDETVRMAAVTALRNFPPSAELSTLISQLRDTIDSNDNRRAHHAIEAVGELRVTSAVMQLINLLDTDDSALIDAIGRALQTITKQDFGQSRIRWSSWWRRRQDEPRLQWLLEGLAHSSAMLRSAAQDELTSLSGDVVGYRFDQPRRERDQLRKRWAQWWQRRGYPVN